MIDRRRHAKGIGQAFALQLFVSDVFSAPLINNCLNANGPQASDRGHDSTRCLIIHLIVTVCNTKAHTWHEMH